MPGALLIVCGIAAVDMLNPGTIAPALVFAVSPHGRRRVLEFALGFFIVNAAGGILLVLGPAKWLFDLIPHVGHDLARVLEIAGGVALLVVAALLLAFRERLVTRDHAEDPRTRAGSAFIAGAGIAAAELPTAFPYFAAIAAIEAEHISLAEEVILIVVFNAIFLAPVVAIALLIHLFPAMISSLQQWMSRHWPQVLAGIAAAAGVALIVVGVT
jgi:cytochrome c biogenesis protein CcdA